MTHMDDETERHRRICEARDWLRKGYTSAKEVNELLARVADKRGEQAAATLQADMREQWRCRRSWWEDAPE